MKIDIPNSYLFNSLKKLIFQFNLTQKNWGSVNFGRLAIASALGELSSEHAVFNI